MSWIGIKCDLAPHALVKWGNHLRQTGGGDGIEVGEFLCRCAELVSGAGASSIKMDDRMREIEARAVANMENKRNDVMFAAGALITRFMDGENQSENVTRVLDAAGVKGWNGGRQSGNKNGGIKKSRAKGVLQKRKYVGGGVVRSNKDGSVVSTVESRKVVNGAESDERPSRGGGAGVCSTLRADKSHALSFQGWCATQLRKEGFKVRHISRALGLGSSPQARTETWRKISGYERYWKRQALAGVIKPAPPQRWLQKLEDAAMIARGKGRADGNTAGKVVLNGNKDCGSGTEDEDRA